MKISKLIIFFVSLSVFAQDSFVGVVKPKHNINLSLSIDGIVDMVLVKEGSVVKKGDALVVLKNSLQKLETQRRKLIWLDKSKLNSSMSEEEILSSLYHSTKELYETSGGVSKEELQSLKIKYLGALGESRYLKEGEKREQIEYEIADSLLEQYTLLSPINGTVTRVNIDLGEFVKNTEPILSIVDSTTCSVELNLDKLTRDTIKEDQIVTIYSDNAQVSKQAKIVFISPIADRSSGLFFVKAEFSNQNLEILPGLTVEVNLINKIK